MTNYPFKVRKLRFQQLAVPVACSAPWVNQFEPQPRVSCSPLQPPNPKNHRSPHQPLPSPTYPWAHPDPPIPPVLVSLCSPHQPLPPGPTLLAPPSWAHPARPSLLRPPCSPLPPGPALLVLLAPTHGDDVDSGVLGGARLGQRTSRVHGGEAVGDEQRDVGRVAAVPAVQTEALLPRDAQRVCAERERVMST